MVSWPLLSAAGVTIGPLLAAEEKAQPLLMRLDPQDRAKVIMALLGLVLVGVALVAFALMAGRQVVRIARKSHGPTQPQDDWYRKPIVPPDQSDRDPQ